MKIQCSCGSKYAFDITPEMAREPVRFVCQNCGLDSSEYVTELVRRELATESTNAAPVVEAPRLRVSHAGAAAPANEAAADSATPKFCPKHVRERVTEHCVVCRKPICSKCLELFGFVCSPHCKAKAEAQGIFVPAYAGQKTVVEGRFWRKAGAIFTVSTALIAAAVGVWIWYAWFGSVPKPVFSVRFDEKSYSGQSRLCGKDQLVFLHGGTLARYDLKTKKQIWSLELVTKQQIADAIKFANEEIARENQAAGGGFEQHASPDQQERYAKSSLEGNLSLRISGQNIWIGKPYMQTNTQLTHYDWDTGKILQQVIIPDDRGAMITRADELLLLKHTEVGAQFVTHVNLANGEMRTEEFYEPGIPAHFSPGNTLMAAGGGGTSGSSGTGLTLAPGADTSKPMDPQKVAEQVQSMPLPARIALPATLSANIHEQQLEAELKDGDPKHPKAPKPRVVERFTLIPSKYGYLQSAVRLIEYKTISHVAMKAPPKKSTLDGDLTVTKTADVANEMLNEMQRNRGGDTVEEDASRYQVTLRRPDSPETAAWSGEVTGSVELYPLKNVNVLTAGKTVIVFDKSNKKLWQAALTYTVSGGAGALDDEETQFGAGPCVEHGDTLYVFDQAVLSAFDLNTGNARWRLPSVGVIGLFFDDKGMLYVNSTTADPENIKYSRQIDVRQKIDAVLFKIDPKTGKTLWSAKPGGFISYLSGKYLYVYQTYDPGDEEALSDMTAGLESKPYVHIRRISPKDGHIMWNHYQERAPLDVRFDGNTIELVFRKEVQVLKFLAF